MMAFCRKNNIQIEGTHPYFKKGTTSAYLKRILAPLQNKDPDVIFMVPFLKDAELVVSLLKEMKIKSLLCGGAGGFTHEDFCNNTQGRSDGLVTATLWSPDSYLNRLG